MHLSHKQQIAARHIVHLGIGLLFRHSAQLGYSEGGNRWEGIDRGLRVGLGQFPRESDCSSSSTWLWWNALLAVGVHDDTLNGEHWRGGYTGTLVRHGRQVSPRHAQLGDLVFYGPGWPYKHVAVYIGGGYVASHGSPGEHKLGVHYRPDFAQVRAYI